MPCNPCKKTRIIKTNLKPNSGKYGKNEVVVKSITSYNDGIMVNNTDGSKYKVAINFSTDGLTPVNLYNASGTELLGVVLGIS